MLALYFNLLTECSLREMFHVFCYEIKMSENCRKKKNFFFITKNGLLLLTQCTGHCNITITARRCYSIYYTVPILSAMSAARSPHMPFTAVTTLSPGSTELKMAHSMAVCPVPLTAKVTALLV